MSRFWGLRSLCRTFLLWQYARPRNSWNRKIWRGEERRGGERRGEFNITLNTQKKINNLLLQQTFCAIITTQCSNNSNTFLIQKPSCLPILCHSLRYKSRQDGSCNQRLFCIYIYITTFLHYCRILTQHWPDVLLWITLTLCTLMMLPQSSMYCFRSFSWREKERKKERKKKGWKERKCRYVM